MEYSRGQLLSIYEDIEQVKVHNCMWSIEQTIQCENKLWEEGYYDN